MSNSGPRGSQNFVLSRLVDADFWLLKPHLSLIELPRRKMLEVRNRRIDHVYFIESGFASVVALDARKRPIEVGIIGREGMTGLPVLFRSEEKPNNETYMQAAGDGWCIAVSELKTALDASSSLHNSMLRYANSFVNQMTRTVVANGHGKIEERLARWLVMAEDRLGSGPMNLTQEFLAMMLAVQRTGVTAAVNELEQKGLIKTNRGEIEIIDRDELIVLSNGTYIAADYE